MRPRPVTKETMDIQPMTVGEKLALSSELLDRADMPDAAELVDHVMADGDTHLFAILLHTVCDAALHEQDEQPERLLFRDEEPEALANSECLDEAFDFAAGEMIAEAVDGKWMGIEVEGIEDGASLGASDLAVHLASAAATTAYEAWLVRCEPGLDDESRLSDLRLIDVCCGGLLLTCARVIALDHVVRLASDGRAQHPYTLAEWRDAVYEHVLGELVDAWEQEVAVPRKHSPE
jgi:hypothetical protein